MNKTTYFFQTETQKVVLVGIIVAIMIVLSFTSPHFLTLRNFTNVFLKVAVIVIIASAANLLMITGNFDLSVGSILAFSGILHAYMCKHGVPIELSMAITCLAAI